MNILIGGAWPYANGSLHIGHIAALIPGDVIARYYRLSGQEVLYVSGSDCHGTPIAIRAKKEGILPKEIADKYHDEFRKCFEKLNFSYDYYSRTDDDYHKNEVQKIIKELYANGLIYKKDIEQVYCEHCHQFLPDRYVEGICPKCGNISRGDQCDHCSSLLDPLELSERKCKLCGGEPTVKKSKQLYFALSRFEEEIKEGLEKVKDDWRVNAVNNTKRYIDEGLQDRAISRDLSLGIDVPIEGFEDKKIYVWIDAVLGYLTVSKKWGEENKKDWSKFWKEQSISYYIHGKDNIPFHSIILPSLLSGVGFKSFPQRIVSSEYVTLEGKKISTSNNWAVSVPDIIEKYNSDLLRYFFISNGPEKRDTDFSWRELINKNNGELLGAYGNLVNRTLVFAKKYFNNCIPNGKVNQKNKEKVIKLYETIGEYIEKGYLKIAIDEIFDYIRSLNKYFDEEIPWITVNTNIEQCRNTIYNCLFSIINIANLIEPFLPESSVKIKTWLGNSEEKWKCINIEPGNKIGDFEILFERLDKKIIDEELSKLKSNKSLK